MSPSPNGTLVPRSPSGVPATIPGRRCAEFWMNRCFPRPGMLSVAVGDAASVRGAAEAFPARRICRTSARTSPKAVASGRNSCARRAGSRSRHPWNRPGSAIEGTPLIRSPQSPSTPVSGRQCSLNDVTAHFGQAPTRSIAYAGSAGIMRYGPGCARPPLPGPPQPERGRAVQLRGLAVLNRSPRAAPLPHKNERHA